MASNLRWKYWKSISSIAYFSSGIIAGTALSAYAYKSFDEKRFQENFTALAERSETLKQQGESSQRQRIPAHGSSDDDDREKRLAESIKKAESICEQVKAKYGLPGLSIAVSVNGNTQWARGFGFADLENEVKMEPNAVMRIGSISKSMTMGMLAQLMEENKIDIDLPVQNYVPNFPKQQFDGKEVTITTRHLLLHLSGIRHYATKEQLKANPNPNEMELKEYFLKENFESVDTSLKLFQNDELIHEPGAKFTYTTHGWTLVSAVLEKITGTPFEKYAKRMFKTWGLDHTYLDENNPIINHRVRPYSWDKKTQSVQNSPYVDNSYKWSGGGFLSSADDVVRFGNIMLASYQNQISKGTKTEVYDKINNKSYLKSQTMAELWKGDPRTIRPDRDTLYGLGFQIAEPMKKCFFCKSRNLMAVNHSGAAIGGSSILLITFPKDFRFGCDEIDDALNSTKTDPVKGVVVAMLTNLTDVGLTKTAEEITNLFEWLL